VTLRPESLFVVTVNDDEIRNKCPNGKVERVAIKELRRVLVATNDSGPVGADVWWILEGSSAEQRVCFPQGAVGESAALDRLRELPGFQIRGMNSTRNAQFECWPHPQDQETT
jgi:hypothetical protein